MILTVLILIIIIVILARHLKQNEPIPPTSSKEPNVDASFPLCAEYPDDRTFVAIDCETATTDRMICELGVVVVENGSIVKEADYLIQPPDNRFDAVTIRVHKITPKKTENSPTFEKVWPEIRKLLIGKELIAHNAAFDSDAINKNLCHYGLPQLYTVYLCTSKMLGKIDLASACAFYGIDMGFHHNALDDARACALLRLAYLNNPVDGKDIPRIAKKKSYYTKCLTGEGDVVNGDSSSPFYGATCVLTGVFDQWPDRNELAEKLMSLGARVTGSVSGKTDFLICGEDPGVAKIEKAEEYRDGGSGIEILEESDLSSML